MVSESDIAEARRKALRNGEEDPVAVAQRYLNVYRQMHIFSEEKKESFDQSIDRSASRLDGDIRNLRDTISTALNSINSSNMEQMDYFYKKLASFENTVNNRQLDMLNVMNARLKEISEGNAIAFKDISEKTEKLTLKIRSDMDRIRVDNNQKLDEDEEIITYTSLSP